MSLAYKSKLYVCSIKNISFFDRVPVDIKTKLSLFDKMTPLIILYEAEVWGLQY